MHPAFLLAKESLNVPRGHGTSCESPVIPVLFQYPEAMRRLTKYPLSHPINRGSFIIPESELTGVLEEVNAFCHYNNLVSVSFPLFSNTIHIFSLFSITQPIYFAFFPKGFPGSPLST